jgi:hypothetical protein
VCFRSSVISASISEFYTISAPCQTFKPANVSTFKRILVLTPLSSNLPIFHPPVAQRPNVQTFQRANAKSSVVNPALCGNHQSLNTFFLPAPVTRDRRGLPTEALCPIVSRPRSPVFHPILHPLFCIHPGPSSTVRRPH